MSENWKPGDVAMWWFGSADPQIALRVPSCPNEAHVSRDHWHLASGGWTADGTNVRRLVVLDLDDSEKAALLERAERSFDFLQTTADAIREQCQPSKPEEPTEFAALAIDADGEVWHRVRDGEADGYPWATKDSKAKWQNLKIVRTLPAPSVTP